MGWLTETTCLNRQKGNTDKLNRMFFSIAVSAKVKCFDQSVDQYRGATQCKNALFVRKNFPSWGGKFLLWVTVLLLWFFYKTTFFSSVAGLEGSCHALLEIRTDHSPGRATTGCLTLLCLCLEGRFYCPFRMLRVLLWKTKSGKANPRVWCTWPERLGINSLIPRDEVTEAAYFCFVFVFLDYKQHFSTGRVNRLDR